PLHGHRLARGRCRAPQIPADAGCVLAAETPCARNTSEAPPDLTRDPRPELGETPLRVDRLMVAQSVSPLADRQTDGLHIGEEETVRHRVTDLVASRGQCFLLRVLDRFRQAGLDV